MKKTISLIFVLLLINSSVFSQKEKLYDIDVDPSVQYKEALTLAKKSNKHVMVQIGGNWCPWCYRFHDFHRKDAELDSMMNANYVLINVNYNPKNNQDLFEKLDFPQRFGFPVIVITDAKGKRLHTQNSWYLEDGGNSYDKEKVKSFIKNWTVEAVSSDSYKK